MAGATHARRTPRGAALGAVPVTRRFLLARPVRTAAGVVGIGLALMLMLLLAGHLRPPTRWPWTRCSPTSTT
jgi:hypothetical protein